MCGISGILNLDLSNVDNYPLEAMVNALSHRGPDGSGVFAYKNIGLGHNRLSIIDLSKNASQPMQSQDGRFVISYNGELYNYLELKSDLINRGYKFQSDSDTEVLMAAIAVWGVKSISKFNGMFAFAVLDKKLNKLYLGRDRYGIKPLYYYLNSNVFLFASEIKSLKQHPAFKNEIDNECIYEYFNFQNIFTDKTFYKNVKLFPSGSYAEIQIDKNTDPKFVKFWDFNYQEHDSTNISMDECIEELDYLFKQAVNRQLMSDVEIGSYLSGGMDSGSITAIAAKENPNLKSFTCGFDLSSASGLELTFDERDKAELMSAQYKTEHYEIVLKSGDMERCFEDLVYHLEEPRVGQSYPNFYAAKLTSKFVKVTLSGTGGDELFGGYPWRYFNHTPDGNFNNYIKEYYKYWQRLMNDTELQSIFRPLHSDVRHLSGFDIFNSVFAEMKVPESKEQFINSCLYFESKTFLQSLLIVEDKLSMAHGLETRVPFLDNDLVDFAMKLPISLKIKNINAILKENENDFRKKTRSIETSNGKFLLREMMKNFIPKEIYNAKKQGFSSPDSSWFKGESMNYVKNELFNKDATIYNFLDFKTTKSLISDHLNGNQNRRLLIWSLLYFSKWLKQN
jgi:asparagine synthase (glutamine-hydrolysing)